MNSSGELTRRQFLTHSCETLCAASLLGITLSACAKDDDASSGATGTSTCLSLSGSTLTLDLACETGLAADGGFVRKNFAGFNGGKDILVMRQNATTYRAVSVVCPHAGVAVENPSGGVITCSAHGSQFSGSAATLGALQSGPATSALPSLSVTFNAGPNTLTIT